MLALGLSALDAGGIDKQLGAYSADMILDFQQCVMWRLFSNVIPP